MRRKEDYEVGHYGCAGVCGGGAFPSTKRKDCLKKLNKYEEAGVKEYWMIDPQQKKVIVYEFEKESYPTIYGINGQIPVGLYEGKLMIDMNLMEEMIQDYPDGGRD